MLVAECSDFPIEGLEQNDSSTRLTAHFAAYDQAEHFARHFAERQPQIDEIIPRNWAEEWQSFWKPILVGRGFYLSPAWIHEATPAGRIRLEMRPGLVFGGGDHATTQLCLELIEEYVKPGMSMADIGCGSGILTDAAAALHAGRLAACDIDSNAAEAAAQILQGAGRPPLTYTGSADALRDASFDIIAANLLTDIVTRLLPEFARILKPGGLLIASGFLVEQRDQIQSHAEANHFQLKEHRIKTDWAASVLERLPPTS